MKKLQGLGLTIGLCLAVIACGPKKTVQRTSADTAIDLSGNWNDVDSQEVSKEMIGDCLSRNWLTQFRTDESRPPVVIVGTVKNKGKENINVQTFVKDLQKELINSGQVEFVSSSSERSELREERSDMAENTSDETMKAAGNETGADFMLKGQINIIEDAAEGEKVKFYQVELELHSLNNNKIVWTGQKKIKKQVSS